MNEGKLHQGAQPKFSREQDNRLISLVNLIGEQWNIIARTFKNKSAKQCKNRWMNYLSPNVRKGPWTPEEDELLKSLVQTHGQLWKKISTYYNGRSPGDIRYRYLKIQRRIKRETCQKFGNSKKYARLVLPMPAKPIAKPEIKEEKEEAENSNNKNTEFDWNEFFKNEIDQFSQQECFYGMESIGYM